MRMEAETMADEDGKWSANFQTYRIVPLVLFYEDVVPNYERTVQGVLKVLGLPHEDASRPSWNVRPTSGRGTGRSGFGKRSLRK
jgi:LPS sulfotransferase NodH